MPGNRTPSEKPWIEGPANGVGGGCRRGAGRGAWRGLASDNLAVRVDRTASWRLWIEGPAGMKGEGGCGHLCRLQGCTGQVQDLLMPPPPRVGLKHGHPHNTYTQRSPTYQPDPLQHILPPPKHTQFTCRYVLGVRGACAACSAVVP